MLSVISASSRMTDIRGGAPRIGAASGRWIVEIVKRAAWHKFVIFTKHWFVERTPAWIG